MPFYKPIKAGLSSARMSRTPASERLRRVIHDQNIDAVCPTGTQYLDPVGIGLETQALWPGQ
jgi:hypothetical protein